MEAPSRTHAGSLAPVGLTHQETLTVALAGQPNVG